MVSDLGSDENKGAENQKRKTPSKSSMFSGSKTSANKGNRIPIADR